MNIATLEHLLSVLPFLWEPLEDDYPPLPELLREYGLYPPSPREEWTEAELAVWQRFLDTPRYDPDERILAELLRMNITTT